MINTIILAQKQLKHSITNIHSIGFFMGKKNAYGKLLSQKEEHMQSGVAKPLYGI